MQPKIIVGLVVAAFAIGIGVIALSGEDIANELVQRGLSPQQQLPQELEPLNVALSDISVLEVTDRRATVEIKFEVTNPNQRSIILQVIKYQLYGDGLRLSSGEIGQRAEGMVASSDYFVLLANSSITVKDKIILQNTGNTPQLWDSLMAGDTSWRVTGDAIFNLSSVAGGSENEVQFEFER